MVPRTFRKQIVLGIIIVGSIVVLGLLVFAPRNSIPDYHPIYSATGDSLDLSVLDGIVAADKNISGDNNSSVVRAVVVPHHLVASKSIALGIKALASSSPKLIIVISPDHFARCPKLLCTTKGSYKTFFGNVSISEKNVVELEKSLTLMADSQLFTDEHGVYSIIPFIKHYIPDAQIVPITISQHGKGTEQERTQIVELLEPLLARKDVSLVISSDFSHYLSLVGSNKMDVKTQNSFCSGNSQEILTLQNPSQSDCPLCLWILEQEAQKLGFWNPNLIAHTNSANILHNASVEETTSHFTFALSNAPTASSSCPIEPTKTSTKILFVGDMSFDRYIRQVSNKKGGDFVFSCIDDLLKNSDFTVGNLEGPITDNDSRSIHSVIGSIENYVFTFPTTTAQLLARHNIQLVNLGNNHVDNFGEKGIAMSKSYLDKADVHYIGGLSGDEPIYRTSNITFVSYNEFGGQSPDKIASIIAKEKLDGQIVIVYAHWGEEYSDSISSIKTIASLFSEKGADVIIGSHPHIILPHEYIGKTLVYYSLGNFIFDQYFDSMVTKGLAVQLNIFDSKIDVKEYPIILKTDGRTCSL